MPPPPPPSKSYLLTFDTSSDEEIEVRPATYDDSPKTIHSQNHAATNLFSYLRSSSADSDNLGSLHPNDNPGSIPESDIDEDMNSNSHARNKKGKKKRKKKKKQSKSSSPLIVQKKVTFGNIEVREVYRDIHSDGVPMDGGWPLGLGSNIHKEYSINVDTFEQQKQIELVNRYKKYIHEKRHEQINSTFKSRRKRSNSKSCEEIRKLEEQKGKIEESDALSVHIPESFIFETRPYDYKRSTYTPPTTKHSVFGENPILEWEEIKSMGRNVLFRPLVEAERKELLFRDAPSHFHLESSSPSSSSVSSHFDDSQSPKKNRLHANSVNYSDGDLYCSSVVTQIRNELEQIRIHRSPDMSTGCSCRKLVVILPKDIIAGGGKKAHHHRRMHERKVKEELRKRNVPYSSSASREILEQLLYDTVEERGCCADKDCECFRNGIMCQADTCSCWNPSHNSISGAHKKGEDHVVLSNEVIRQNCGNENGIYIVDFDGIQKHRDQYIKAVENGLCGYIN